MVSNTKKRKTGGSINNRNRTKRNSPVHMVDNSDEKSVKKQLTIVKDASSASSEFIPKYKIVNRSAFSLLELDLNRGQSVIASTSAMAYMDAHINLDVAATGGFFSSLKRAFLTSSSFFLSKYTGTSTGRNKAAFSAPHLPEDIVPILLKPGESIMISPNSLLCYTKNLEIHTKRRLRGIFVGEGGFQTNMRNYSNKDGIVWLTSYGGYYKLEIKEGEAIKLDNGLFLCSPTHVKYGISKVGSLFGTVVSGEGLVMHFEGPATIHCQGRSLNKFVDFIRLNSDTGR